MDEPTHAHESQFWDQVADWVLDVRAMAPRDLSAVEIDALRRFMRERQEPP